MKLLKLYQWIAGTSTDFCRPFQDNEALYNQARSFWAHLESQSIVFLIIFIVFGALLAWAYYMPFNEKAGRHYKPKYWAIFMVCTLLLVFTVTLGFEYFAAAPKLKGALLLETKIALANSLYATGVYVLISWIWCQFNLPTNAYRLIKF